MRTSVILACILGLVALTTATIHFQETFDNKDWEKRWVKSTFKESEGTQGKWEVAHGSFYGDAQADKGLRTSEDARFYQITAAFDKEFSNKDKDLIVQYSVKHEQKIDCGGGYLKILPTEGVDQKVFNGDTPYNIMFGPDICGTSTRKTHLIFNYKGKNHLIKKEIKAETDEFTHLYTLILSPNNTYRVEIDGAEVASGSLKEDWDMLPPKEIKDPKASKPADWVDEKTIPDPEDKKPEGWDDIPKEIPDPAAVKPEDWDDDLDGEWERPVIANPEYKGEWQPRMIENPAYKGEWVHPLVPNPDYYDDDTLYLFEHNKYIGIEIWQVKSGTIFDNFLVTDDLAEARKFAELTNKTREGEKKMFDKQEEERKAKEEEERKAREAAEKSEEPKEETPEEPKEEKKEKDEL
jgi:calreticulin